MGKKLDFDRDKAKQLYLDGKTATEIGKILGVNYQSVIAHLKKEGIYKPVGRTKKVNTTGGITPIKSKGKVIELDSIEVEGNNHCAVKDVNDKKSVKDTAKTSKTNKQQSTKKSTSDKTVKDTGTGSGGSSNLKGIKTIKDTRKSGGTKTTVEITRQEKIDYCNKKYGVGNWHFMTKDEFVEAMLFDAYTAK